MKIGDIDAGRWATGAPAISARAVVNAVGKTPRAKEVAETPARARLRSLTADGRTPTRLEMEATIDDIDLVDANFIERCRLVMNCIGRLQFDTPRGRGQATGFLIAPGLLMTNHHVLKEESTGLGGLVQFGFWHDVAGGDNPTVTFALEPKTFYVADDELDFAVVAVSALSTNGVKLSERSYLRLDPETGKVFEDRFLTILQHPEGDYLQIALRENKVTHAPQDEFAIRYVADTAQGSSGAPCFNDNFQIAALHSGGRIQRNAKGEFLLKTGEFVKNVDDRQESEVKWEYNVGIRISRICPVLLEKARARSGAHHAVLTDAMAGGDVLSHAVAGLRGVAAPIVDPSAIANREEETMVEKRIDTGEGIAQTNDGGIIMPLGLKVSLVGLDKSAVVATPAKKSAKDGAPLVDIQEAFEMRIPIIYDDLPSRSGFDRRYLDPAQEVPMVKLTAAGEKVAAPLLDGSGPELKYHKFSIWMHSQRRLALFTASNVDFRNRKEKVDGKPTTRDSLAGFPPGNRFAEEWVEDERISKNHQLPDVFYTNDRGAFDKGHLVRRDDVCWGKTFEDIQMGNGDTYHVTNCSPQTKPFNQGQHGEENWGDLESLIQKSTKKDKEKVVVFAGPVFGKKDRWFKGEDDEGAARIQIPTEYWKIVVNMDDEGFGAYGFLLEQDVTKITEDEFLVPDEWAAKLKPLDEIKAKLRGWVSIDELLPLDRYDQAVANFGT